MNIAKLGAVFVTGALSLAAMPAFAASPATRVFLANVTQNVDFLDRSSRFALTNSKVARVHEFAFGQAREQTLAANALDEYVEKTPDALQTGRSAAVAGQAVTDIRLPMGQEDLDSLEGLTGTEFDAQFKDKQADALNQVIVDYQTYIAKGDDPALLAIANKELPKAQRRLASLRKL